MIRKYRREFSTNSLLDVELWAFKNGLSVEQGGLGRTRHFINVCQEIWNDFVWYEWSLEQAEVLCENKISGFTSGASSSKSDILAKFALVSWFADPVNTLVVVCSTTSTDAKKRIWGAIVASWRKASQQKKAVGHLVETNAIIKLSEKTDAFAASDNSSISLVAAGSQEKDNALMRLQGFKNKHVLLILDELQDCSQEITEAAIWNLNANAKWEIHAAGNAASRFDAHGIFMAPIEGWNSVNRTTHRWKIRVGGKEGIAMHFDATAPDSPNMKRYTKGEPQLPFLRLAEDSISAKTVLGENNITFLRQFCGWWPDGEGESNFLVTEQALTSHEAFDKPEWESAPTEIAGIDPSYSNEGDEFIFHHMRYGKTTNGLWTIASHEEIPVRATPAPGETKDHAAIRACKHLAEERGMSPRNLGLDNTGGNPLLSIAHMHWSSDILGVPFGGSPTDLAISLFDKRLGKDVYANAVSELWGIFVEFLNANQIRGIKPKMAKELTARKFEITGGGKLKVEKKSDMKKRLGYSPDRADSFMVGLRVLRERLKIQAGAGQAVATTANNDWKRLARRRDVVTKSDPTAHHDKLREMFKSRW